MPSTLPKKLWQKALAGFAGAAAIAAVGLWGAAALDRAYPPPLEQALARSAEVVDRDGNLLRAFATEEGRWRLDANLATTDRHFVELLIAYEDKRFRDHHGVDPLALLRAAGQLVWNGRIVSGGSTLSMQLARLIEPRERRSFSAKLMQALRAIQIERRLTKDEILRLYLTLAPYGGNLEGIRAASLAWFGKEPKRLTLGESALLVALPQLPELRRPDRNPKAARAARERVLERAVAAGVVGGREAELAMAEPIPSARHELPALAPHLAGDVHRADPAARKIELTLSRRVQEGLEQAAREAASRLGPKLSVAMVMADAETGEILGEVGSADYFDRARDGFVDMTKVARSPGSTLKPFIYGLAFEDGRIAQETIIEDRPANFAGYRPRNFDMAYQGDVSIRTALQMSLNVPAVRLLDAVGPHRLMSRFRHVGVEAKLPEGEAAGLAIALGGLGLTLRDLVQLYTALPGRGRAVALHHFPLDSEAVEFTPTPNPSPQGGGGLAGHAEPSKTLATSVPIATQPSSSSLGGGVRGGGIEAEASRPRHESMLPAAAAWQVADILIGVTPPKNAPARGLAYKTGTSYGYRDAWAVGFDGRHVLGVWVGRPDGGAVPGISGYETAAPILFEAFAKSGIGVTPLPRAPAGALRQAHADLPPTLRRFGQTASETGASTVPEKAPRIVFPPQGAHLEMARADSGDLAPLVLKLQGGRAPFRWLANGKALPSVERRRTSRWSPDGAGYQTLTVIDAAGRAASVRVFVE